MDLFNTIPGKLSNLLVVLLITSCTGASHIKSYSESPQNQDNIVSLKLDKQSDDFYYELKKRGLIYSDKEVNGYITNLGNKLTPAFLRENKNLNFYVLKDPTTNAMAFSNGNIFINIGLLSIVENEDQLASVLAHEISHVVHRHSLKSAINRQESILTANIADIFLVGTGFSYLGMMGNIASHSREQEKEADLTSIKYLKKSNFDVHQAPVVFKIFESLPEMMTVENSAYSSHPDNKDRSEYLEKLIVEKYTGLTAKKSNPDVFESIKAKTLELNVQMRLLHHQYSLASTVLDNAEAYYRKSSLIQYYRGEVNRLKAENPGKAAQEIEWLSNGDDSDLNEKYFIDNISRHKAIAKNLYLDALKEKPDLARAYKGLGLLDYSNKDYQKAVNNFETYLALSTQPSDELYIKRLIRNIKRQINNV